MNTQRDDKIKLDLSPIPLLNRAALIRRWQHGSDAFFWRQERAGRLHPVLHGGLLRYSWHDVFVFEGGLPSAQSDVDYFADLMLPEEVAKICNCAPDFIMKAARNGILPARRIGRASRFVPGEVALWQRRTWSARTARMNEESTKTTPFSSDE